MVETNNMVSVLDTVSFTSNEYNGIMSSIAKMEGLSEMDYAHQNKRVLYDLLVVEQLDRIFDYCVLNCDFRAVTYKKKKRLIPIQCVKPCIVVDNGGTCPFDDDGGGFDDAWNKLLENMILRKLKG